MTEEQLLARLQRCMKEICMRAVGRYDDDLRQEGLIAGWMAMATWREGCGCTQFSWMWTKAYYRTKDVYRDLSPTTRRGFERRVLHEVAERSTGAAGVSDDLDIVDGVEDVLAALRHRSERDQRIVALHATGHLLRDIGEDYGISESRASQIFTSVLDEIHRRIAA